MASQGTPGYLIAVYACIPAVLLALVIVLLYVFCSKRYRLNWYERTLLEERCTDQVSPLLRRDQANSFMSGTAKGRGIRAGSLKTEWLLNVRKMGSSPSSPTADASEKFWVPPTVIERKRAQSLVPSLSRNDSDEEISSGVVTPASIPGLRELAFTFPSEKLTGPMMGSEAVPSTPPPAYNQRRRASMHDAIDFTKIDTRLYDKKQLVRQSSVSSLQEEQQGSINLSMEYNKETSILTVHMIQARDLVPRDFSGTADPYCKVSLLPEQRSILQSKIHRKTVNPEFEEEFVFEVSPHKLAVTTLEVLLYDYDQFSRDECIGQVHVPLELVDLSEKVILWKGIIPCEKKDQHAIGDLMFSLCYLPSAERLTIVVTKARNLRHSEEGKITLDPYVKATLSFSGKKLKKKKTSTKHNTTNPVWNEALVFNLGKEFLNNICLELAVYHDNKIGNDELLGKTQLGPTSEGDEMAHWKDLISAKSAVARWHNLS
ncbi:synaptotagmin-1-like [Haliotis asinina]|uniref:synaptotagmin-1-like n=1 Tax=Haliotis asinina TaxID=109174 RepID=UPI00353191D7